MTQQPALHEEGAVLSERKTTVARHLRRTWVLLALALCWAVLVASVVLRGYVADVFPRCRGTLEGSPDAAWLRADDTATYLPLDADRGGFSLHLETVESGGQVTWAKMVRLEVDANGGSRECGGVVLHDQHVSNAGGALWPQPDGTYVYVDKRWRVEGTVLHAIERPTRHVQRSRLVARRHLPAMFALFALLAIGLGALRARRSILYATKLHAWLEARVEPGGRIESESGATLGVIGGGATLADGQVLVSPSAGEKGDAYRGLPIFAHGDIALGSHARWRAATMRRLRHARVLAVIGMACSVVALVVNMLGA